MRERERERFISVIEQSLVILVAAKIHYYKKTSSSSFGCFCALCLVDVPFGQCLIFSFFLYCSVVCGIFHGSLFCVLVGLLGINFQILGFLYSFWQILVRALPFSLGVTPG